MTRHDSKVGKAGNGDSNSKPAAQSGANETCCATPPDGSPAGPTTCWWWWPSEKADESSVGRHTCIRLPSRCGSGFNTGEAGTCELPSRIPVTCCTICRKFDGSAVMKVVGERLEARDFRFVIFPPVGIGFRARFGADSGSDVEGGAVSGLASAKEAAAGRRGSWERDFWRAMVRASVSRAMASENHVSENGWRNGT